MNIELARYNMIEQQIRPWDVLDQSVLSLLAVVKREDFLPPSFRALAFVDTEVPLTADAGPNAPRMLSPKVEARLLQELAVHKHERVLEIGTGSGFMAALLGHKAQHVLSLEINAELVALARSHLQRAGVSNVTVRQADGTGGAPDEAPFDVIVLSGSVFKVPATLLDQLKVGGRLIAIEGRQPVMRAVLYTRDGEHALRSTVLFDTVAPRLAGFAEPTRFVF